MCATARMNFASFLIHGMLIFRGGFVRARVSRSTQNRAYNVYYWDILGDQLKKKSVGSCGQHFYPLGRTTQINTSSRSYYHLFIFQLLHIIFLTYHTNGVHKQQTTFRQRKIIKMRTKQATTSTPRRNKHIFHQKTATYETLQKKKRRNKPGTVALRQIKHYQNTTDLLLRLGPFQKLVREIAREVVADEGSSFMWSREALECLQWAAENYMVCIFVDTSKAATHAKRVTVRPEDLALVRDIRSSVDPNEM